MLSIKWMQTQSIANQSLVDKAHATRICLLELILRFLVVYLIISSLCLYFIFIKYKDSLLLSKKFLSQWKFESLFMNCQAMEQVTGSESHQLLLLTLVIFLITQHICYIYSLYLILQEKLILFFRLSVIHPLLSSRNLEL